MAATSIRELAASGTATDSKGIITAERRFLVQIGLGDVDAVAVNAIPVRRGDIYLADPFLNLAAQTFSCERPDTLGVVIVTVKYTNDWGTGEGSQNKPDPQKPDKDTPPLERPIKVTYSQVAYEQALQQDFSSSPLDCVNSAGEPFDPPLLYNAYDMQIDIELWKPISINADYMVQAYFGTINTNAWGVGAGGLPYPAKSLLCKDYKWTTVYEQNQWFWQLNVSILYRPSKWYLRPMNVGTYERIYSSMTGLKWQRITDDKTGAYISTPVPISLPDVNGAIHKIDIESEDIVYLQFQPYLDIDWDGGAGAAII